MAMEDHLWLYTVFISTFIFIIIYLVKKLFSKSRRKELLPPSPPAWPIIGHLHLLKQPMHRTLETISTQYGPVFGLKLGFQYTVVVSSPAAVEECFTSNDIVLADRPQFRAGKHLHFDNSTMGAINYGDQWRSQRRISNQEVFSMSRQNMFLSIRQDEVKSMIKSLFLSTKHGIQKVEMKSRSAELAFNIIVRIVIGKRYYGEGVEDSVEAKEFRQIIREMFDLSAASNPGDFLPFLRLIDFGSYEKRMLNLKKRMDKLFQGFVDEHRRKHVGAGAAKTMINNILALQETDSTTFSDKTIKSLVMVLITAGTDTAGSTIEWALSLLLNNPEKLKKAQAEIDTVIGLDRLVDEPDLAKLPYLQCIISETYRLYPVAPLLVPHFSSGDCTIQGFHVPRDTLLFVNAWALHRDPKVWEDPLSFKPERFVNVEESLVYKLVPFGTGRRACPGASMANKEVGFALASLIQCFEWERIGDEEVDMSEGNGLTMPKLKPLEAMCQPRSTMVKLLSSLLT